MTSAQVRALDNLWPVYGLEPVQLDNLDLAFGKRAPLHFEIGIGNGDNIVNMAQRAPARHFLGCEVHRPGLGHALHCLHRAGLNNLRLLAADAEDVLRCLPPASLDAVEMFFPDPWPKKRHHKRRLLRDEFLELLADTLKPSGCFHFATDNEDYAQAALAALAASSNWFNPAGIDSWAPRPHSRIVTRFEGRANVAGRPVFEIVAALRLTNG